MKRNTPTQFFVLLVTAFAVLSAVFASPSSVARAEEVATCQEQSVDYDIVLAWAVEAVKTTTTSVLTLKYNLIPVDFDLHVEVEYISESGEVKVWSGTMELNDTCDEAFVSDHEGWVCPVTSVQHDIEIALAEGEGHGIIPLSFEQWKESVGKNLTAYYTETVLLGYYYSYVISLVGVVTTDTLNCTPPPWRPGVMETMLYVVNNPNWFGQWVSFYWENPEGALIPIEIGGQHYGMNITQWGDVSFVLAREDRQANEGYGWYQTLNGPVQVNTIIVAVLNGQVIQRSLVTPNDPSGEPDIYVLSADKANQMPRLWQVVNEAWR